MRWITAGESHGQALSAIIEGMPAHVSITTHDIDFHLARRRLGVGRGARQNFEADKVSILGGVRLGVTQGGPISVQVGNSEWPKWEKVMSADPVPADEIENLARNAPLSRPRPGHADLVGMQKYDFDDARPILERASARETAARVALGAIARNFLEQAIGITILSHVVSIGSVRIPDSYSLPAATDMNRIDAAAMMGIQAIKGVEIGDGFRTATRRGSVAHDEIERGTDGAIHRRTDRAGGTEGGMSNGEILRVSVAMKPISTVPKALDTIDVKTGEAAKAINQRSDVCAVPAAGVVAEAMAALVLAEAVLEKFGGDSVQEVRRNYESYMKNLRFK